MHAFARFRLAILGVVALAVLVAMPGSAFAAKPTFHDKIDDTFPDSICGVDGTSHVTGSQVGQFTFDANGDVVDAKVTGEVTQVFTTADGRSVRIHVGGSSSFSFTDNGDGTATVVNTYKGLPEQIRGAKGGPVLRDAGLISFVTTFDLTTGDVISSSVVSHGPHPEADSDFTLFCTAFLAALG